ncbi:MAG: BREX-3 system P-loop-containing protein BrxF [Methylococcaceae bacterium]
MDQLNLGKAIERAKNYQTQLIVLHGEFVSQCIVHASSFYDLPIINLSLELSNLLLTIPSQDRAISASSVFTKLIAEQKAPVLLLDHIEIIFDRSLSIDPLKLLQNNAKNTTLIISWPGEKTASSLAYATPSHSEYRCYKTSDFGETIFIEVNENNKEAI